MAGALTACCRQLLRRRRCQAASAAFPGQPRRAVLLIGPHDPLTPDSEEPGADVNVKQEVPERARLSYRQRIAEWRARHFPEPEPCNVGLPRALLSFKRPEPPGQERMVALERLARSHKLRIDLDSVERAWEAESRPEHALAAARHYSIMEHLFGPGCYFSPVVPFRANFADPDKPGMVRPAVLGNILAPRHCATAPELTWLEPPAAEAEAEAPGARRPLWTVLLTSPDANLQSGEREFAHWLVADVPGSGRLSEGRELLTYLQPLPPLGTGWHRYALLLFLQSGPLDLPSPSRRTPELLADRDFSTAEFYRRHEHRLTPAGLCFFQAAWDDSVRRVFRGGRFADIEAEPAYEFSWPARQRPRMEQFAFSEPFNIYLDKYRDTKDIAEETLKEKLKTVRPFKGRLPPESRYPLAAPPPADAGPRPSWLAERERAKILRQGQWSGLD